jgi:hypothetical protein
MGVLTIQSGPGTFTLSRDVRLGIIAAKLKCHAEDLQTALFAPAPDIGIQIPEWNPRTLDRMEAGDVAGFDVTLSYEGHPEPDKAEGESFEIEGATADDPIESHWNYEVLLKNYKGTEDASSGRAKWPRTLTDANGQKGRNRMHGVESWPSPGLIWNHNFTKAKLPESLVQELGTVSTSIPGNPPPLSGGRNWLCIRVRGKNRGNIWQLQRSWQLSGPYGWVPEMFRFIN